MSCCSKCDDPSSHAILVYEGDPPKDAQDKDKRGVRVIRFCPIHWSEVAKLLPSS